MKILNKIRRVNWLIQTDIIGKKLAKMGGLPHKNKIIKSYLGGEGNLKIKELLLSGQPTMVCRYGASELQAIEHFYLRLFSFRKQAALTEICIQSGFFPNDKKLMPRFISLYAECAKYIDILIAWNMLHGNMAEKKLIKKWSPDIMLADLSSLEAWLYNEPWTECLHDKKVLLVHPFERSIRYQYDNNREKLFFNPKILPKFKTLDIIRPPQAINMENTDGYNDWFDAYDDLCRKIEASDFDVAIIGAGAWGLPLAAFVKKQGKQAIHLAGSTQLLFGIKGGRWELPSYGYQYKLYNEYWKRPYQEETPKNPNCDKGIVAYW